jgi:cobalt/nickel transport system permease protein
MSHRIDGLAYTNRLRHLPPAHKLGFAIGLLGLSLIAPVRVQLLISSWLTVAIVAYAGIPSWLYVRLLMLPTGFWLASLPPLIIHGVSTQTLSISQADVWHQHSLLVGPIALYISQTGLHQVGQLIPRVWACISCTYFILLTVPFTQLLQTLRHFNVPTLLIELLLLMYRFIFNLLAIADDLWIAQQARSGYRTYRRGLFSLSLLVGQLLQRTLEDYRQLSLAIEARGFNGEFRVWQSQRYQPSKRYTLEALIGSALLIALTIF